MIKIKQVALYVLFFCLGLGLGLNVSLNKFEPVQPQSKQEQGRVGQSLGYNG